jgi:hypothetical protein
MSRNRRNKNELVQGISIERRTKSQYEYKDRQDFGTRAALNMHRYGLFC